MPWIYLLIMFKRLRYSIFNIKKIKKSNFYRLCKSIFINQGDNWRTREKPKSGHQAEPIKSHIKR